MKQFRTFTKVITDIVVVTIGIVGLAILCVGCTDKPAGNPKIKSLTVLTKTYPLWYSIEQKEEIESRDTLYLKHYEEYDSLGNIIVEKFRRGDVILDTYHRNKYSPSGLLVSRINSPVSDF